MGLNHIDIQGRIVRDPEIRRTNSGKAVTSFTIAVDRNFAKGETDFIDCVAWNAQAEFTSKYFSKGRMAVVTGRLESSKWEDNDGNKRTSWRVSADGVYFGDSCRGNADGVYFGDSKKEDQQEDRPKKTYKPR
jgi:single-strand DNA-binding protein